MPLFLRACIVFILLLSCGSNLHAQRDNIKLPAKRSLADIQALPDDTNKVLILNRIAWDTAYFNLALGLEYAQEGLRISKKLNYDRGIISALNTIGATYNDMGNFDDALAAHMEGLDYSEKYGDKKRTGTALMNISLVYNSMGDKQSSIAYLERAIAEYESVDYESGLCVAYINLGSQYFEQDKTVPASKAYEKALVLARKTGRAKFIAHALSGIAVCLADTGRYEEAHLYLDSAITIVDTLGDPYELAKIYANAATIYLMEKDYDAAETSYRKGLSIFREIGVREEIVSFYNEMAMLFHDSKRYDSALVYWKQYMALKDSLVNEDVLNHQRNLEALYESEKGKQEIELLTRKGNVRRWFLLAIIASFVVLVFLVIMLFKRNQFRKTTNRETERQNAEIEEKNRNITDSIGYASRIQEAVLPSVTQLKNNFTDAFVFSKPKDIVSGDFWWCTKKKDVFYLAGADSTGHGVPGGFMSMLGSVFLFDIITEKGVRSPAAILNHLREKVISTLNRSGMGLGVKDGMDMVMCTFSENNRKVEFSCAMNPLWVIRKNAVIEYRADKFPVGEYHGEVKDFSLLTHDAEPGDMIYIFSDGYADQFGGPDGKKLKYKQLRDILCSVAGMNCDQQHSVLDQRFQDWKQHHEQVDDVLVIGIRI